MSILFFSYHFLHNYSVGKEGNLGLPCDVERILQLDLSAVFSLLIIDEGHHIDGDQFYNIVTRADCERPKILFSASTILGNYPRIDRIVHAVVTQTLKEAILAGELSPLQMLTLDFSMYPEAKELPRSIRRRIKENIDVNIEEEVGQLLYDYVAWKDEFICAF